MTTKTVSEVILKGIREANTFADAVALIAGIMVRMEFLDELKNEPRLYNHAIEVTANELANLIRGQQIVPAELMGENFGKLLCFLQELIPYDLETEINNKAYEWQMIQQELAASAENPKPPHLNVEDSFLEMQYEDRFEIGLE